jgi:hypothetical protein
VTVTAAAVPISRPVDAILAELVLAMRDVDRERRARDQAIAQLVEHDGALTTATGRQAALFTELAAAMEPGVRRIWR